ncbi:MAG: hypothetical protein DRG32_02295 [Deltaproteobacteria bacterium]|nr:MAG: hypothetical protein DRG32_02295 [Deltaproteobacteria bacterium]
MEARMIRRFLVFLVIGLMISAGCERLPFPFGKKKQSSQKIQIKVRKKFRPIVKKAEKKEEVKEEREPLYVYDPTGKRDPFTPFLAVQEPVMPEGVKVSPLQKYDLSQLKLVAIVVGGGEERAMVEDSEGKGYIIKKGTYIGKNFGKVKAITKDGVVIEERYRDYLGRVKTKEIVLKVHTVEEQEEKRP